VLRVLGKSYDEYAEPARELADKAEASNVAGVVLFVVIVVVMAPLVEELFYRGLVHRATVRLLGVPLGVTVTALAFGLAHGQWLQLLPLVGFGVLLSVLAQRTGRLGLGMWTHAGFNATTVVLLLLDDGRQESLGGLGHAMWSKFPLFVGFGFS
jgi:membrane protease YdiL (CAAX protease family)